MKLRTNGAGVVRSSQPDRTRVALITEGTYPFSFGGVSTWCDQLIRGMPDNDFEVVAITGHRGTRRLWDMPQNVAGLTELGFWEPGAPGERPRYMRALGRDNASGDAVECVAELLRVLMASDPDVDAFEALLGTLIEESQAHRLAPALRSKRTVDLMVDTWQELGLVGPVSDVIFVLDVLEHLLRTVSFKIPQADIYHAASNGLAALVAVAAAQATGAPVILSEHGVYLRERYLEYHNGQLGFIARQLLLRFHRLLSTSLYRRADLVVPVSRHNRRWEIRNGVEESRIRVVHNGVDPSEFSHPELESAPRRRPTIGFVGRIDRIKDPLTLIRASASVAQQVPDVHVRLWGETAAGQDDYEVECREEVELLDLHDTITFEGRTTDPAEAYGSVDVVVVSSISEGLPYGILEAMMCGCAIVATDVGGVGEALEDVGVLVEPGDAEAIADACVGLLRNPARLRALGWKARRRAGKRFTVRRMIAEYRKVYAEADRVVDLREVRAPIELAATSGVRT